MSAANGGPAFPRAAAWSNPGATSVVSAQEGMTLRDYFAAKAPILVGDAIIACRFEVSSIGLLTGAQAFEVMIMLAFLRFKYADAMIAERAK